MLTLIKKRIPATHDAAKPFSYADAARQPPLAPQPPHKKFLPSRVLRVVTVQTLAKPKLMQMSGCVVEAIKRARASLPGKVVAARCMKSGDVLVTANSQSTKNHLEEVTR
jgi:hypothetical protein